MKAAWLIFICVATALAYDDPPIKVTYQGMGRFECYLNETIKSYNPYDHHRKDELCADFPGLLDNIVLGDYSVEVFGVENIDALIKFGSNYGSTIEKLVWTVYGDYKVSAEDVRNVFGTFRNLRNVELRGWTKSFDCSDGCMLQLEKLITLTLRSCSPDIIEMLTEFSGKRPLQYLTLDLTDVKFDSGKLNKFFRFHDGVKYITIENFNPLLTVEPFMSLKLLRLVADFKNDKNVEQQKKFLKEMIENNPDLQEVKLGGFLGNYDSVDDSVFDLIYKLRELTTLEFSIDKISTEKIARISNMRKLQNLVVKAKNPGNEGKLYELVNARLPEVEKLFLFFPGSSIDSKTFVRINDNFMRLRQLKVVGTEVKVNFLLKTFPLLVTLTVHYGTKTTKKTFADVYEFDGNWHALEILSLHFNDDHSIIDTQLLSKMIQFLPSLGKLELKGKLALDPNFWIQIKKDMKRFNTLKLGDFVIPCNENFESEKLEGLVKLKSSFNTLTFTLLNLVDPMSETDTRDACFYQENGKLVRRVVGPREPPVDFKPVFEKLKKNFMLQYYERDYKTKTKKLQIIG